MDPDLSDFLKFRLQKVDGDEAPNPMPRKPLKPLTSCRFYGDFPEFSRQHIDHYFRLFMSFDDNSDGRVGIESLKRLMEKAGTPLTHVILKKMIAEINDSTDDDSSDHQVGFREFLLVHSKALQLEKLAADEMDDGGGGGILTQLPPCINVAEDGVLGAKKFFQAKIDKLGQSAEFEAEIKQQQQIRRQQDEEQRRRKAQFQARQNYFSTLR
ncbi:EF-hand domain-containing protein [Trichinella spiralis]|uniref:EF-hand domain-containing protein n=1 Tax=Trichinella spiralis TaxID=6334 RepID=A0ABR3KI12_TRISP